MSAAMADHNAVRGDGDCGSRPLSPHVRITSPAAIWTQDDELLHGTDYEKCQENGLQHTSFQNECAVKIYTPIKVNNKHVIYHPYQPCEKSYIPKEDEETYTGMKKQESRKARGAVEKYIHIGTYIIARIIVYYNEHFGVYSLKGKVTKSYKCSFDLIVGYPEPTIELSEYLFILDKDSLCDIWTLKREEEVYCISRHWYLYIMIVKKIIIFIIDSIKHCIISIYLGSVITPEIRHVLHKIYEKDRNSIGHTHESFEQYIRRINKQINGKKFRDAFNSDERYEIEHYTNNNKFDITAINKLIDICVNYHLLYVPSTIVDRYKDIKELSRKIKDIRNDNFHNLPELNRTVCNDFFNRFKKLRELLNDIVNLI